MSKERYDNLDLLKAIAIILVLMLHTPLFSYDFITSPSISKVVQYGVRLLLEGVPIFVTVNGFLMLKKEKINLKKHICKIKNIFLVLIVWSFILIILGMIITKRSSDITFVDLIHRVLSTNISSEYNGVLWFLQSLLGIYLLYPVLNYIYINKYDLFKYLFIIISFFTVGINILVIFNNVVNTLITSKLLNEIISFINQTNPFKLEWFIFYFMLGGIIYKNKNFIIKHRCLLIISGVTSFILSFIYGYYMSISLNKVFQEWFNSNSIFMVLIIIGYYSITINYKNTGNILQKFISSIGQNTLGIYLSHFIFLHIGWNIVRINSFLDRLYMFLGVFISSYLLTIILGKTPIIKNLILK